MRDEFDYPVSNTFGIKAKAAHFVEYCVVDELRAVVRREACGAEVLPVGA